MTSPSNPEEESPRDERWEPLFVKSLKTAWLWHRPGYHSRLLVHRVYPLPPPYLNQTISDLLRELQSWGITHEEISYIAYHAGQWSIWSPNQSCLSPISTADVFLHFAL